MTRNPITLVNTTMKPTITPTMKPTLALISALLLTPLAASQAAGSSVLGQSLRWMFIGLKLELEASEL